MKKAAFRIIVILILVGGTMVGYYYYRKYEQAEFVHRAMAAKLLVLLTNDAFEYNPEDWSIPYINELKSEGVLASNDGTTPFTYGELRQYMANHSVDSAQMLEECGIDVMQYKAQIRIRKKDFDSIYNYLVAVLAEDEIKTTNLTIVGTSVNMDNAAAYTAYTLEGEYRFDGLSLDGYIDCTIRVMLRGNMIIKLLAMTSDSVSYNNLWFIQNDANGVDALVAGVTRHFACAIDVEDFANTIGDIVVDKGVITKIVLKKDTISGKVLRVRDDSIDIEGYGRIQLAKDFKVYDAVAVVDAAKMSDILVGYSLADFAVADGQISAAIIRRKLNADQIRVLIMTTGFTSLYHERISLTCEGDFVISNGIDEELHRSGEIVDIYKDLNIMSEGRVIVRPTNNTDRIKLLSVKKAQGNPLYRGTFEITSCEEGMILLNEVPIEEYLYAVVPSEMPESYGVEALKVQAVCARSYAYRQIMNNSYAKYGAHVDDSVNFQVYNNSAEKPDSTQAVKETYGEVLGIDNSIVSTYYYSTSCGHSSSNDIWGASKLEYLPSKLINPSHKEYDLSNETDFEQFINSMDQTDYDYGFPYYRWNVDISLMQITDSVNSNIYSRYYASPKAIKTLQDNKWVSKEIRSVGTVESIEITDRSDSGAAKEMIIKGSEATVKITSEYNIRYLLGTQNCIINVIGGTRNASMLPSAFFYPQKTEGGYILYGGGYGHGIGVSQNAVTKMVEDGMNYEEILKYFYQGTHIMSASQNE